MANRLFLLLEKCREKSGLHHILGDFAVAAFSVYQPKQRLCMSCVKSIEVKCHGRSPLTLMFSHSRRAWKGTIHIRSGIKHIWDTCVHCSLGSSIVVSLSTGNSKRKENPMRKWFLQREQPLTLIAGAVWFSGLPPSGLRSVHRVILLKIQKGSA